MVKLTFNYLEGAQLTQHNRLGENYKENYGQFTINKTLPGQKEWHMYWQVRQNIYRI